MRRRLALVFVALAVMLAIGFLVPLGRSVSSQARLRALAGAQSDARGVATALAAVAGSTGELPGMAEVEFVLEAFNSSDLMVLMPTARSSAADRRTRWPSLQRPQARWLPRWPTGPSPSCR